MEREILKVIGALSGVRETVRGYWALCPFHNERHPSFLIDRKGRFYCFGCHVSGSVAELRGYVESGVPLDWKPVKKPLSRSAKRYSEALEEIRSMVEVSDRACRARLTGVEAVDEAVSVVTRSIYEDILQMMRSGWMCREMYLDALAFLGVEESEFDGKVTSFRVSAGSITEKTDRGWVEVMVATTNDLLWEYFSGLRGADRYIKGRGFGHGDLEWGYFDSARRLRAFCASRGIGDEDLWLAGAINRSGAVVFPEGSCVLPIRDIDGVIVAFAARVIGNCGGRKYTNSRSSVLWSKGASLYCAERLKPEVLRTERIWVVEGYFDAVRLWQAGIPAVAIMGSSPTEVQLGILRCARGIVLALDGDEAGRRGTLDSMCKSLRASVWPHHVIFDGGDPDSFLRGGGDVGSLRDRVAPLLPVWWKERGGTVDAALALLDAVEDLYLHHAIGEWLERQGVQVGALASRVAILS